MVGSPRRGLITASHGGALAAAGGADGGRQLPVPALAASHGCRYLSGGGLPATRGPVLVPPHPPVPGEVSLGQARGAARPLRRAVALEPRRRQAYAADRDASSPFLRCRKICGGPTSHLTAFPSPSPGRVRRNGSRRRPQGPALPGGRPRTP